MKKRKYASDVLVESQAISAGNSDEFIFFGFKFDDASAISTCLWGLLQYPCELVISICVESIQIKYKMGSIPKLHHIAQSLEEMETGIRNNFFKIKYKFKIFDDLCSMNPNSEPMRRKCDWRQWILPSRSMARVLQRSLERITVRQSRPTRSFLRHGTVAAGTLSTTHRNWSSAHFPYGHI